MSDPRPDCRAAARAPSGSSSAPSSATPLFVIVLAASLAAGAAGRFLDGNAGLVASAAVALIGAVVAAAISRPGGDGESKVRELLAAADSGALKSSRAPEGWKDAWVSLYERMAALTQERQTSRTALTELERMRRQVEIAINALREGKDPLTEVAELRVGPLRELLEAAKEGAATTPVVSRLPLGEEELICADGDALPEPWPAGADDTSPLDPRVRAESRRGLDELISGLSALATALRRQPPARGAQVGAAAERKAAQLVDAVVHTAADGIEDLAAGLMRANELAGVAERVTNKATLLALNAALEATRSGSEAFAAIAEETRRLAEFAREATDTITRLSSEIEYKVGETITAIHATSEDAKSAVAALSAAPAGPVAPAPPASVAEVEVLLERARAIRASLGGQAAGAASETLLVDGLEPGAILEG